MKSLFGRIAAGLAVLSISSLVWADPILIVGGAFDGTDVGGVDIIEGSITKTDLETLCGNGNSPATEECWAESIITGTNLILSGKTDPVSYWSTNMADTIAFELAFGGGYYLVKNSTYFVLLQNVADYGWGVLNLSELPQAIREGINLGDGTTISHVTEWDGGRREVPEPGTLALLGAGLLGLGMSRRKRRIG